MSAALYCALVHHPVRDRDGKTVTTAVTTLDVHDISRSARTYGLRGYFVVTPIAAQATLVNRILEHWHLGAGGRRMPERTEALSLCQVADSIADVQGAVAAREGQPPVIVATAARSMGRPTVAFVEMSKRLQTDSRPHLLLFGTGHGLADAVLDSADELLEPICGPTNYNHLSVRSAVAIVLDRMCGSLAHGSTADVDLHLSAW